LGRNARLNPRSQEGGKPKAYCSFQRAIRACQTFGDDAVAFRKWLDSTMVSDAQRARMEKIWSELHPQPLVTLHALDEIEAHV
jgi:hypothetical protein